MRNWQIDNGLPDGTVTSVAQTLDGYLWVGTPKGLARFDGISFKQVDTAGDTTLKDSSVVGLLTDREGTLWIASQSGLITQFADGEFRLRYLPPEAVPSGKARAALLPAVEAGRKLDRVFALDGDGAVWLLTLRGEVIRFAGSGRPTAVSMADLPEGEVHGLGNDESGRVWLAKGNRICVFEEGQWRLSALAEVSGPDSLLCPAGDRGCWVTGVSNSRATAKLLQYKKGGGWEVSSPAMPATSVAAHVSAMLEDRQGRVWLAMAWAGVWGGVYAQLRPDEWTPVQATGPLVKCSARCLFEDRQGSIWVGTAGDGLDQVLIPPVRMAMLPPEGVDMHLTTVCTGKDGALWMGTDKGLFRRAPGEDSHVSAVEELRGERVEAVLEDARTNLWAATRTGLFQRESSGFKKVVALPGSDGIMALFESRRGDLWAGGPHGVLLCRQGGPQGGDFELKAQNPSLDIRCIAEDGRGQIWIAAYGSGLWRLDGKRLVSADLQLGAAGPTIRSVLYDSDGALWIGTLGNGLFRWGNGVLRHYTLADGLLDDSITGLASDERGNLWMTSKNGIFGCALRQLAGYVCGESAPLLFRHLGPDEGLAHRQCTGGGQPVISRGSDGRFWAATMAGAAGFDPEMVTRSTFPEEVRVETLTADGQALRPAARAYRVSASTRRFEFQYSAPELAAPKALRFRYRLDDLDQNWMEAGAGRVASYSQLQPGEYRFRVMVGGADGLWHEAERPVALRVVPLFWQTAWFRILGISGAVLALAGGVALNERRKASRQLERLKAQQAMERERRRIARDLHDDLGSGITEMVQIGDLTLQPEIGMETLRSRVETMTTRARQLGIIMDEIVWTVTPRNDTLPNLVGYICNHAQEFFRHSAIKCRLDVTKSLPVLAVDAQTRHNIFLAVKEALNNAAKHSGANEVWVRVHYIEDALRVCIEDNGRGFDGAAFDKGDGLTNMRERLQSLNGKAEFLSQTGSGAKVLFTLALNPSAGERK